MNKFLADAVGIANAVLAVIIVVGSLAAGSQAPIGVIGGAIGGVILAVVVCGTLALLIEMRRELAAIRAKLSTR